MENKLSPMPINTRIGINTGDMVVGNMGTQKKMNYTIVSNAVNLAARLEGVNKFYGTWILASEATVKETHGKLLTRRLDRIRVVGINEPVQIYEIIEAKSVASHDMHKRVTLFEVALDLFENRCWKEAEAAFTLVLRLFPDDKPSSLYLKRCQDFQRQAPAAGWDGVFNITGK